MNENLEKLASEAEAEAQKLASMTEKQIDNFLKELESEDYDN